MAFDGTGFIVVWERDNDVWGVRVAADATVGTPFAIAASPDAELAPHVAAGPGGEVPVTYERFDFDPAVMGFQARGRRILPGAIVPTDGGAPDGGAPDGGGAVGSAADGGVMGRPFNLAVGCNCGETSGWPAPVLLAALAWALTRRSRQP